MLIEAYFGRKDLSSARYLMNNISHQMLWNKPQKAFWAKFKRDCKPDDGSYKHKLGLSCAKFSNGFWLASLWYVQIITYFWSLYQLLIVQSWQFDWNALALVDIYPYVLAFDTGL